MNTTNVIENIVMNLMGKKKEAHYSVVATEGGTHLEGRDPKYFSDQFLGFFPTQYDGSPTPIKPFFKIIIISCVFF